MKVIEYQGRFYPMGRMSWGWQLIAGHKAGYSTKEEAIAATL